MHRFSKAYQTEDKKSTYNLGQHLGSTMLLVLGAFLMGAITAKTALHYLADTDRFATVFFTHLFQR
jgi:hypothetical protein